jgi:glycosyltransferase EpsF
MDRAGAETMLMNIYREIDRSSFQFDFLYFTQYETDYDEEIEKLGGRIFRVGGQNFISRFFGLIKILKKNNWEVVHSHMLFGSGLYVFAAWLCGVSMRVSHSHSTRDDNDSSFLGFIYQKVMRLLIRIFSTNFVACGTAASGFLFNKDDKVLIVQNAVDINKFSSSKGESIRNELELEKEESLLVQVGRFMPVKNQLWTIDLAKKLDELGFNFRLALVGDGQDRKKIEKKIFDLKLNKRVVLLGLRGDIPEIMAAADVMLMPSLYEGFPVVLVESQASGLYSVVSDSISNEVDLGLGLISFASVDDGGEVWVDSILKACSSAPPSIEERAEALIRFGFSSRSAASKLEDLYNS